nr:hypothetical protein B0A51_12765 [Rachicladosporium sp. CCFEE 5018]
MKRKAVAISDRPAAKRPRADIPDYHATPQIKEDDGSVRWPAPTAQIERAREIMLECALSGKKTLIVPDKDADGLSSGAILRHTLILLGLRENLIDVHLLSKGNNVFDDVERARMLAYYPDYVFVIDQGSRSGPPIIDKPHTGLVIDHHFATEADFPKDSDHVSACHSPPVATSSLLTYLICEPLHDEVRAKCDWLAVVGAHGDLGNTLKWEPPFPSMTDTFKKYTKKLLNDIVSLVNAPRRTATYDVISAWDSLATTEVPSSVLKSPRLLAARQEVNAEVERCTHAAPKFSADGKIAVFRIRSEAQVHPVIATRWAGHLQSKALEIVMVANEGYVPDKVNFSCRIARCARGRETAVDIIQTLKGYAAMSDPVGGEAESVDIDAEKRPFIERLGDNFARGHVQASGGIVGVEEFEELMRIMQVGVKVDKPGGEGKSPAKKKAGVIDAKQKNTLAGYFAKA